MFKNRSLPTLLFVVLVLALCFAGQAALASTVVVGTCKTGVQFATIQAAVNAAPTSGTVDVCPGTYPEQVKITKKLTVIGIVSGTNDAAVVVPPSGGVVVNASDIFGNPVAAQIFVEGAVGATISHLTVDGSGNGLSGCATNLVGIYYQNSSGTITDNAVRNQILDPADIGCQQGLAINVESTAGTPAVIISTNSVRNYDKNGITADGLGGGAPGPNVTVKGNTVIGIGATPAVAQNGIQIGLGATASVTGNYVADDIYTGENFGSSGILIYASTGVTATTNTVESTQLAIVTNNDPMYGLADGASISSNHIGGTQNFDAIDLCSSNNVAESNTIYGSAQSAVHTDDECPGPSSAASGNGNTVEHNTINEACAGILEAGTGNVVAPNTFLNVTNTVLAGDTCAPIAGPNGARSAGKHQSLRPSPYKSNAR
jgi:hypothetical protein